LEDRTLLCVPGGVDRNDQICETDLKLLPGETSPDALISPLGDVDIWEIEVFGTGDQLEFTFDLNKTSGSGLDPFLRVFNEDGVELDNNDDRGILNGGGTDSQISIDFGDHGGSGTYYLGASSCDNEEYDPNVGSSGSTSGNCNSVGGYTITASDNNDEIDEALGGFENSGTGSGFIDPDTDVDLFRFIALGGQSFKFEVDGDFVDSTQGLDSFLRVFDDGGDQLASDNNSGGNRDAELTLTFPETGIYYVGVSGAGNSGYDIEDGSGDTPGNSTGFYTISATEVNLDPDDTFANAIDAGNLFTDGTFEANDEEIDSDFDVDMFKFVVERDGSFVEIDIDRPTTGVDSFIRLFRQNTDGSRTQVTSNDDANAPGETGALERDSFIGRELAAGTYFVGVSAFQNTTYDANTGLGDTDGGSTGSYSIQIQDRLHVDTSDDSRGVFTLDANDDVNTLREAVEFANDRSGAQEITFRPGPFASPTTITLAGQPLAADQLHITDDLTITGPAADLLSISGDDDNRVFLIDDGDNSDQINVFISGVTVTDGNTSARTGNSVSLPGAGIKNTENLTLTDVTIANNRSDLFIDGSGQLRPGKDGGGIHHSVGTLNVHRSTFVGNSALSGGGLFHASGLSNINNTTVSGNSSAVSGGGLHADGLGVMIRNSTITGNRAEVFAGGIANSAGMHNTIVASNFDSSGVSDLEGLTRPAGMSNNLIGSAGIGTDGGLIDGVNGNIVGLGGSGVMPIDTILDTNLADNGGTTKTHALVPGSLAIGAGSNSQVPSGATDQTGDTRIQFGTVDIGAVESPFETLSLIVSTTDDVEDNADGETSLREAINFANAKPGADRITFAPFFGSEQTIQLGGTQLPIVTDDLTIDGFGQNLLTIDANDSSRHLQITGADVTISGVTLTNGNTTEFGGAIRANQETTLSIDASTISSSTAEAGGGIFMFNGTLNVLNGSVLNGNTATNVGGAIVAQDNAVVTIGASTISANTAVNQGGGILMTNGTLNILNGSTLGGDSAAEGNHSDSNGGAIASANTVVTIDASTISQNSAGDKGGGIFMSASTTGPSLIVNSTFSGNSAGDRAGALSVESPTVIRNSTFTGNRADSDGDGAGAQGGIFAVADQLTMHNTIVAGNFKGTGSTPSDLDSNTSLVSGSSHNLIGSAVGGSGGLIDGVDGNIVGVDGAGTRDINTVLDTTLADNGGPTLTHALVPGSVAINKGDNDEAIDADDNELTTDQRGTGFDRIKVDTVDIGAIEAQDVDPVFIDAAGVLTILGTPENDTVTVTTDATTTTISTNFTDDFEFANDTYTSVRIEGGQGNDNLSAAVPVPVEMFGGQGNDTLTGGSANDTLDGGDGNDVIDGGAGADSLLGGEGADSLLGNAGKDTVFGGAGNDTMRGGGGNDRFEGEAGDDVAFGDGGKDSLFGGDGNDSLEGGSANDRLYGNNDNDTLIGGTGNDFFSAHDGDDLLQGDVGNDYLAAGDGNDELRGGDDNDTLIAGFGEDTLHGDAGLDSLHGGPAADVLFGGDNADSMAGGGGGDTLSGGDGNDTLLGGAGKDLLQGEGNSDSIDGGGGADDLIGASGNDTLLGGAGNDTLNGGNNSDSLTGGSGNDELLGGSGNDTLNGGSGNDNAVSGGGADVSNGGSGNDTLTGSGGADSLKGSNGNDLIIGSGGSDTLSGGNGNDALFGGTNDDSLTGDDGEDLLVGYNTTMSAEDFAAVHAEWTSNNTHQERVNNLRDGSGTTGGGANGNVFLPAVLTEDSAVDTLLGLNDLDYFWGTTAEVGDLFNGELRDGL
jgi:hypothetical protein